MKRPKLKVARQDAVWIGRGVARSFDFPLLSKCLKPDVYGIKPIDEIASQIFQDRAGRDNRTLPNKHTVRCSNELERRLQTVRTQIGGGTPCTFQELSDVAFLMLCEHYESKRREEGVKDDLLKYGF